MPGQPWPKSSDIDPSLALSGQMGTEFGRDCPKLGQVGPALTEFDRVRPDVGHIRKGINQIGRVRPELAQCSKAAACIPSGPSHGQSRWASSAREHEIPLRLSPKIINCGSEGCTSASSHTRATKVNITRVSPRIMDRTKDTEERNRARARLVSKPRDDSWHSRIPFSSRFTHRGRLSGPTWSCNQLHHSHTAATVFSGLPSSASNKKTAAFWPHPLVWQY